MLTTLEPILAKLPFCNELEPGYLRLLVGCAANVVFHPGDVIFRIGDEVDYFYLIRSGKVAVELSVPVRGVVTVQTLSEGHILGWAWLIPPYRAIFAPGPSSSPARSASTASACGRNAKPTTTSDTSCSSALRRLSFINSKRRRSNFWIFTAPRGSPNSGVGTDNRPITPTFSGTA